MGEYVPGLIALFVLLAFNAFFVGAEFALIAARRDRLEALIAQGKKRAKTVLGATEHLSMMLAAAQLGITICSLLLGKVSEPAIAHLLEEPFAAVGVPESLLHPISFAIALLFIFESAVRNRQAAAPGPAVTLIAAVVTIVFFDVGMLGWMLLLHFNGIMPAVTDVTFVFLMQVGLVLGFIAGAPAISPLLRRGFKAAV